MNSNFSYFWPCCLVRSSRENRFPSITSKNVVLSMSMYRPHAQHCNTVKPQENEKFQKCLVLGHCGKLNDKVFCSWHNVLFTGTPQDQLYIKRNPLIFENCRRSRTKPNWKWQVCQDHNTRKQGWAYSLESYWHYLHNGLWTCHSKIPMLRFVSFGNFFDGFLSDMQKNVHLTSKTVTFE